MFNPFFHFGLQTLQKAYKYFMRTAQLPLNQNGTTGLQAATDINNLGNISNCLPIVSDAQNIRISRHQK